MLDSFYIVSLYAGTCPMEQPSKFDRFNVNPSYEGVSKGSNTDSFRHTGVFLHLFPQTLLIMDTLDPPMQVS